MPSLSKAQFYEAKVEKLTKSFDKAVSGIHTRLLYNGRSKQHMHVLCQLRSGINRLKIFSVHQSSGVSRAQM